MLAGASDPSFDVRVNFMLPVEADIVIGLREASWH